MRALPSAHPSAHLSPEGRGRHRLANAATLACCVRGEAPPLAVCFGRVPAEPLYRPSSRYASSTRPGRPLASRETSVWLWRCRASRTPPSSSQVPFDHHRVRADLLERPLRQHRAFGETGDAGIELADEAHVVLH